MIKLEVKLFARARDLAGKDALVVELNEGARIADLRLALAAKCPALASLLTRSALAVNDEFADDEQLAPADAEVALLPPVSGGRE